MVLPVFLFFFNQFQRISVLPAREETPRVTTAHPNQPSAKTPTNINKNAFERPTSRLPIESQNTYNLTLE